MSISQPSNGFLVFIADLKKHATATYESFVNGKPRTWFSKSATRGDPSQLPRPEFNRDELNAMYEVATSAVDAGTVSDVALVKKQIDFLGQAERASRIRYASITRCHVHAHARRYSQGNGPLFSDAPGGIVDNLAQDMLAGARNTSTPS